MAEKSLITAVTACWTIAGRTVFEIDDDTDDGFSEVIIDQDMALQ